MDTRDVAVIGAGPSGAVVAALLRAQGHSVSILEQSHFPRFSIGESLLPQCMVFVDQANLLADIEKEKFQYKDGAVFARAGERAVFNFEQKFSSGPFSTYQVPRARFDHVLAMGAERAGAEMRYGHKITGVELQAEEGVCLRVESDADGSYALHARFLLDASGFGRVLPRLLQLDQPSNFPSRRSVFTHIEDGIVDAEYDRNKILIVIHPQHKGVWYWLIPFSDGRCSVGVVAEDDYFQSIEAEGTTNSQLLKTAISESPDLRELLRNAIYDTQVRTISGYACDVSSLVGPSYALLGNAGEFLDPVFSSGVTIAMKSASLAAPLVDRQLRKAPVDWEQEYSIPLKRGVNTFRAYVDSWYDGSFQDAIFASYQDETIRSMICSILAGYAWDEENPFVAQPKRRLGALVELCRAQ